MAKLGTFEQLTAHAAQGHQKRLSTWSVALRAAPELQSLGPQVRLRRRDPRPCWCKDLHMTCAASGVACRPTKRYVPGPRGQGLLGEACCELLGHGGSVVEPFLPSPPPAGTGTVLSSTLPLLDYLQN